MNHKHSIVGATENLETYFCFLSNYMQVCIYNLQCKPKDKKLVKEICNTIVTLSVLSEIQFTFLRHQTAMQSHAVF